jgi:hypothetical protein
VCVNIYLLKFYFNNENLDINEDVLRSFFPRGVWDVYTT